MTNMKQMGMLLASLNSKDIHTSKQYATINTIDVSQPLAVKSGAKQTSK